MILQQIAGCSAQKQDWTPSVKEYEILSRTPQSRFDPNVMKDLARVYAMAGMNEKAIAERARALRYGYEDSDPVAEQCQALSHAGKIPQAISIAEPEARLALLWELRADAHFKTEEFSSAISNYTAAIDINPSSTWLLAGRALAYSKSDAPERANKDLATLEIMSREKVAESDLFENNSVHPNPVFDLMSKSICERLKEIVAAALRLKPSP